MLSQPSVSILLVDDERRNVLALEAALATVDCRLVRACSGLEALKCVLAQDFAVIVLDIHMPVMDGFETASLIRARDRSHLTPIIFLTADDRRGPRVLEGYRLGAVDYIYNPFDPDILRSKVSFFVDLFRKTVALEQRSTELNTLAAELERSEEHFRALVENASDVMLILEQNTVIRYASPSVERILGYSCDLMSGHRMAEFIHPDDVATFQSDVARLTSSGAASPATCSRWRHVDGSYRVLEATGSNLLRTMSVAGLVIHARDVTERNHAEDQVRALNGELEGRVLERTAALEAAIRDLEAEVVERLRSEGTLRSDVSARRQAEDSLRESEQRLRLALEVAGLGTFDWDLQSDRIVWSEALERMVGLEPGAFGGTLAAFQSLVFEDDLPGVGQAIAASLDDDAEFRTEFRVRRVDGVVRWMVTSGQIYRDSDGRPTRMLGVNRDVTEQREAQQQREAMAQSEKLRALGQMASGIAHDLNQSLMLVASYGDLARRALMEDPPNLVELEDLLTTSTQAAYDGGETVKRLLLFTRAAPEQDSQPVDIGNVVREAAQLTAPRWRDAATAEGRHISLHIEADGHPIIQGSPARLRELMTNLIFNAVDAMPSGGTIRLRVAVENGKGIIEVVDSGVGMSAEVRERVFEPFFTTKGESGTGLGLAMVFGIVEQHSGHIVVTSAPGEGTTFRMTFPLMDAAAAPAPTPTSADQAAAPRPLRILAVDDEPMMTRAVVRMLKPSGHLVSVAGSGEEALQRLAEQTFDVVVSDMGMGAGMNGWELAEAVKRRWPELRFMLATGWGAALDPAEATTRGVDAVLSKPYRADDLLRALARTETAA